LDPKLVWPALAGLALITSVGCQRLAPPEPERAATLAAAAGEPIVFRTDPGPLDATGDGTDGTLTLADAVRLSARYDPRIQAALSRVRIAEAASDQARLLPNPIVNVALRFPTGGGKPVIDAGLAAELVALLQQPGRVSAADSRLRGEAANAVGTVLDVLSDTREAYAAVQALDAVLVVQEDRRRILDRLLQTARARLDAGEATQLDVTTLETQRVELETEIADKVLERSEARLTLARLIGQPSGSASWPVTKWEPPAAPRVSERRWVALALERRPQVAAREFELKALGAERALTRFAPFDRTEVGGDSERDPDWTVGPAVSLPVPLFDMGQATRARASAAVSEARHNLQEARREAIEETRRAYATYQSSKDNLSRVQGELLPLQERRLAQAEAQYRAGQAEITALFLAEQDLRAARARLIELQRRTSEALIRLEKAAGGPGVVAEAFAPATKQTGN
jgi:cobalt-zinc-cadmium efflux system outer membrane protein